MTFGNVIFAEYAHDMDELSKTAAGVVERLVRAICIADGVEPDAEGCGLGVQMPEGEKYPLWKARLKQTRAVLEEMIKPPPGDPHRMHASWEDFMFVDIIKSVLDGKS